MIWSLDICPEQNLSVIRQIREEIDPKKIEPCIYLVKGDLLIIYGTGAKIEIDFSTKISNVSIFNQIPLDNGDMVKKFYWGSLGNEEISNGFVVNFSRATEVLCHMVKDMYDDNLNENIMEATQNHYSYNQYGKGYRFFHHEPNNYIERNKKDLISLEDILKRWMNFKNQRRDVILPKIKHHAGILLYKYLNPLNS